VVAVVIALVLGISVFFKVDGIEVSGNIKYKVSDISAASGIKEGDHLLTFSRAQAASKIITALPYVESVRIGIKLPGTVKIDIVEAKVPYAVQAADDTWWLVTSSGKVIEKALAGEETGYTRILGVQLDAPVSGSQAVAKENNQPQTDEQGNTIPVAVTQAKHLETALNIAEHLEDNGIIGTAATIEVEDLGDIQFWYGQRYQVKLGDETQLLYKISCVKSVIDQMNDYQSGILDASFKSKPDGVVYKAFSE
jgi:cell division protein FtsQ